MWLELDMIDAWQVGRRGYVKFLTLHFNEPYTRRAGACSVTHCNLNHQVMLSRKPKAGGSHKSKVRVHLSSPQHRTLNLSYKSSKQSAPETEESQDDTVSQLLGATIVAINVTRDLVPIDLAKGILGTVASILTIAQVR